MWKIKSSKRIVSLIVCAVLMAMVALPINANAATYDISTSFTRSSALDSTGSYYYSPSYQGEDMNLDVYMPNFSGSDWIQGTIYLINATEGTSESRGITNAYSTNQTLTWDNLDYGDQYYFYYNFVCFGSSNVGYIEMYVK